jgi:hypothetical protein
MKTPQLIHGVIYNGEEITTPLGLPRIAELEKDLEQSIEHIDNFVERLFCEEDNLQILCKDKCHQAKTNKERGK